MSKKIIESKPRPIHTRSIKTKFTKKMDPYFFDGNGKYKGHFNGKFIMDYEGFSFEGNGHMEGEEYDDYYSDEYDEEKMEQIKAQNEETQKAFDAMKLDFAELNKKLAEENGDVSGDSNDNLNENKEEFDEENNFAECDDSEDILNTKTQFDLSKLDQNDPLKNNNSNNGGSIQLQPFTTQFTFNFNAADAALKNKEENESDMEEEKDENENQTNTLEDVLKTIRGEAIEENQKEKKPNKKNKRMNEEEERKKNKPKVFVSDDQLIDVNKPFFDEEMTRSFGEMWKKSNALNNSNTLNQNENEKNEKKMEEETEKKKEIDPIVEFTFNPNFMNEQNDSNNNLNEEEKEKQIEESPFAFASNDMNEAKEQAKEIEEELQKEMNNTTEATEEESDDGNEKYFNPTHDMPNFSFSSPSLQPNMSMRDFVRICSTGPHEENVPMEDEDNFDEFDDLDHLLNEKKRPSFAPAGDWKEENKESFEKKFIPNGFGESVTDVQLDNSQLYQSSHDNEYEKFIQQMKGIENNENNDEEKEEMKEEVEQNPFKSKRVRSKHVLIVTEKEKMPKKTKKDRSEKEPKEKKNEKKQSKIESNENKNENENKIPMNKRYSSLKEVQFEKDNETMMNEMMNMTCFDDE